MGKDHWEDPDSDGRRTSRQLKKAWETMKMPNKRKTVSEDQHVDLNNDLIVNRKVLRPETEQKSKKLKPDVVKPLTKQLRSSTKGKVDLDFDSFNLEFIKDEILDSEKLEIENDPDKIEAENKATNKKSLSIQKSCSVVVTQLPTSVIDTIGMNKKLLESDVVGILKNPLVADAVVMNENSLVIDPSLFPRDKLDKSNSLIDPLADSLACDIDTSSNTSSNILTPDTTTPTSTHSSAIPPKQKFVIYSQKVPADKTFYPVSVGNKKYYFARPLSTNTSSTTHLNNSSNMIKVKSMLSPSHQTTTLSEQHTVTSPNINAMGKLVISDVISRSNSDANTSTLSINKAQTSLESTAVGKTGLNSSDKVGSGVDILKPISVVSMPTLKRSAQLNTFSPRLKLICSKSVVSPGTKMSVTGVKPTPLGYSKPSAKTTSNMTSIMKPSSIINYTEKHSVSSVSASSCKSIACDGVSETLVDNSKPIRGFDSNSPTSITTTTSKCTAVSPPTRVNIGSAFSKNKRMLEDTETYQEPTLKVMSQVSSPTDERVKDIIEMRLEEARIDLKSAESRLEAEEVLKEESRVKLAVAQGDLHWQLQHHRSCIEHAQEQHTQAMKHAQEMHDLMLKKLTESWRSRSLRLALCDSHLSGWRRLSGMVSPQADTAVSMVGLCRGTVPDRRHLESCCCLQLHECIF
uniref:Uncharacterized protein n=1 Tax=Timema monikensis TaxID=170555 RepID=A0A7R9HRE5_9NEOP|nr:unnamed protein product [Timema monikensis]